MRRIITSISFIIILLILIPKIYATEKVNVIESSQEIEINQALKSYLNKLASDIEESKKSSYNNKEKNFPYVVIWLIFLMIAFIGMVINYVVNCIKRKTPSQKAIIFTTIGIIDVLILLLNVMILFSEYYS